MLDQLARALCELMARPSTGFPSITIVSGSAEQRQLVSVQVEPKLSSRGRANEGRPESGIRAASRELGIESTDAHRAVKVASTTGGDARDARGASGSDDGHGAPGASESGESASARGGHGASASCSRNNRHLPPHKAPCRPPAHDDGSRPDPAGNQDASHELFGRGWSFRLYFQRWPKARLGPPGLICRPSRQMRFRQRTRTSN
jgi:hypothetical protein